MKKKNDYQSHTYRARERLNIGCIQIIVFNSAKINIFGLSYKFR